MRPANVPHEVVDCMVWASLCERMDPETTVVRPSWIKMMREIHVRRKRFADVISELKLEGKLKVMLLPNRRGKRKLYRIWGVRRYQRTLRI